MRWLTPVSGPLFDIPPGERVSHYGNKYTKSTNEEWSYYQKSDFGWLHACELHHATRDFHVCAIDCVPVQTKYDFHHLPVHSETALLISKYPGCVGSAVTQEEADSLGLILCTHTGYLVAKELIIQADYNNGALDNIHTIVKKPFYKGEIGRHVFQDFVTKEYVHLSAAIGVQCPDGQSLFRSTSAIYDGTITNGGKIKQCPRCERYFTSDCRFAHNPQYGETCMRCFRADTEGVIRRHDDRSYLPPLSSFIERVSGGKVTKHEHTRLFGVEIETEFLPDVDITRGMVASSAIAKLGHDFVYAKHDGSLSGERDDGTGGMYGFELVTAPADIITHAKRWPALAECEYFPILRAWNRVNCGMHVHVSRDSLNALQLGRILVFINHKENQPFIRKVSGRFSERYANLVQRKISEGGRPRNHGKYIAVRTELDRTIEFRMFRGTVNPRHIVRNIEFVSAVCDFCAPASRPLSEVYDFRYFLQFVSENRRTYPLLAEWCASKRVGLIKKLKQKPGCNEQDVDESEEPSEETIKKANAEFQQHRKAMRNGERGPNLRNQEPQAPRFDGGEYANLVNIVQGDEPPLQRGPRRQREARLIDHAELNRMAQQAVQAQPANRGNNNQQQVNPRDDDNF